jgi:hypothetical protein
VEDSLGDKESDTMKRLRDGQVKLGTARYEQYVGSQKRIVNQIGTGTVSRHIFECTQEKIGALMGMPHVQG